MPRDRLILVAIAGLTGVIVLLLLLLVLSQRQEAPINLAAIPDESQPFPIVGREHIPVGVPPTRYNSDPPTSGDHYAAPVRAGFYEQRLPDAYLIHNLEHGQIWLSWRDLGDHEVVETFRRLHEKFPEWVVVSYRPENEQRLVAAAWGRLLPLDAPGSEALTAFIMRHHDRAPESVPG